MISVSGGLIVTRASSDQRLGTEFQSQVFGKPQPLMLASGVLGLLALFPGLPTVPFLVLGAGLGTVAWRMKNEAAKPKEQPSAAPATQPKENFEALMKVDAMSIEVGGGLVSLVAGGANSPLIQKIAAIRRHFAGTSGFLLPPVRVTDNVTLKPREYLLMIKGGEAGRFELRQGCEMAIPGPRATGMDGISTADPAFGLPALWITADRAEEARSLGYMVVDSLSVLGTHLTELVRRNAHEIFTRQDTKAFLDRVTADAPKAVEELVPKLLSMAAVQRVLQNLLREQVPIRDGLSIIEALGEAAATTRNPVLLTEYVRQALRRTLVKPLLSPTGELRAWFLDPGLEHSIEKTVEHSELNSVAALAPQTAKDLIGKVGKSVENPQSSTVVIVSTGARYFVRQYLEANFPNVHVLAHNEIPGGLKVQSLGLIQ
jgi:flagellar biosynthesis protein FlhA